MHSFWAHYWEWYPPVGFYIAILGLLAVLVPLFREFSKIGKWEKACYTFIFFLLVLLEIKSIYQDRKTHETEQADARKEQIQQFEDIANRIEASNTANQKNFVSTLSGIKKSIDTTTGGNTFCYAISSTVGGVFALTVVTKGENPLHSVDVEYIDADLMRKVVEGKALISFAEIETYSHPFPTIPFLSSSSSHTIARIPVGANDNRDLQFHFFSMNGVWTEALKLRRVNGQWEQALKVVKINSGRNVIGPTLYEYSTPNYPKTDGKVDWDK